MEKQVNRILQDTELKNIQGIIISGYGHLKHTCYLFLNFNDKSKAKPWLSGLLKDVSSAKWDTKEPPSAFNLAFTYKGIKQFDKGVTGFSEEFSQGMKECDRSRRLGDTEESAPKNWEDYLNDQQVQVLMILQAKDKIKLVAQVIKYINYNQKFKVSLALTPQFGYQPEDFKEHFGFADSISQPYIENSPASKASTEPAVKAGEFILGYLNEYKQLPLTPIAPIAADEHHVLPELPAHTSKSTTSRDFGYNGSYLVFRKLHQDVFKFREYLKQNVAEEHRGLVAAKCVGRWPEGAPLISAPKINNPGVNLKNDFGYAKDLYGESCPIGSHIRRANPRDAFREDAEESYRVVNRHRILRRGVLYGDVVNGQDSDNLERGVHFVCINADIRRQFEFIQQNWLNNNKFGDLYDERDPIAGNNSSIKLGKPSESIITIPSNSIRKRYKNFPRIVTVRGGGYFFLPSIPALRFLADMPAPRRTPSPGKLQLETPEINEEFLIYDLAEMLIDNLKKKYKNGKVKRDAHPKSIGLLKAEFIIDDNLPNHLKQGIFAGSKKKFKAWIRFSNSGLDSKSDAKKELRGMAIKLLGVPENEYAFDEPHTQDFVLVSVPIMAFGTIDLFHDAVRLLFKKGKIIFLLNWILKGRLRILLEHKRGEKRHTSPLDIRFWSTTPYQFGIDRAVKYSVIPTSKYTSKMPFWPSINYLTHNMSEHLKTQEASFDFMVQFFQDQQTTPIENARICWQEEKNPFLKIATIKIPKQEFINARRKNLAENLSFSPGHTSEDLKPLGGINRARISIYNAILRFRLNRNKQEKIKHSDEQYDSIP